REHSRSETLVLAGPVRDVERAELDACVRASDGRVRHLGFVPDPDLPALYSGARCAVMPSSYEGFGLPALEALACGTPVAGYDAGALAEVAGPGALLVAEGAMREMLEAIGRLCDDDELRGRLAAAGRDHARTFSRRLNEWRGARLVHLPTVRNKYLDTFVHTFLSALHAAHRERPDVALFFIAGNSPMCLITRGANIPTVINVDGLDSDRRKWPAPA